MNSELMDKSLWIQMWKNAQTGFHLDQVNPLLEKHASSLELTPNDRVFVPLCGKSLDLVYLLKSNFKVIGIELSPFAIEQFFKTHALNPINRVTGELIAHECGNLTIFEGDYYALNPETVGPFEAIYDRAALIAMPPNAQQQYVDHLLKLSDRKTPILLITLDYEPLAMAGPPFATPDTQVRRLFSEGYSIQMLQSEDVLEKNLKFKSRGLTWLKENVWLITPE